MANRRTIAATGYGIAAVPMMISGLVYLVRTKFMPYHAVMAGRPWAEVEPEFQALFIGLMHAFGGMALALGIAIVAIAFKPLRGGESWAIWLLPTLFVVGWGGVFFAATIIASNTPGNPPIRVIAFSLVFMVASFVLSISGRVGARE